MELLLFIVLLLALRIGRGDEVIVPTLSYISSANSILYCGAKPVFLNLTPRHSTQLQN